MPTFEYTAEVICADAIRKLTLLADLTSNLTERNSRKLRQVCALVVENIDQRVTDAEYEEVSSRSDEKHEQDARSADILSDILDSLKEMYKNS